MVPVAPLTLCSARCGQRLRVLALKPECPQSNQLREMGFREQCELLKLSDGGCILCTLSGVRLAIARTLGSAILVEAIAA
jgi:Fe2+ transport system protein FeoA